MSRSPEPADTPDDHRRFSLSEDWLATVIGLVLLAVCLLGLIDPDLIP